MIGEEWARAVELAVDNVNEEGISFAGDTYELDLVMEDNQFEAEQAVTISQRFLQDGIKYMIGPGLSVPFGSAIPTLINEEVMVLTPATTADDYLRADEPGIVFKTHIAEGGENGRIVQMVDYYVQEFQPETVAMLLVQDPPGDIHSDVFTESFRDAGVEIVYSERFQPDTRDFSSYIAAMGPTEPDLVVVGYLDQWVEPFLAQSVEAGFTEPVFVGSPAATMAAYEGKEEQIDTFSLSVTTRAVDNADDPAVADYRRRYEEAFGEAPSSTSFWGLSYYDAILYLAKAIETAGTVEDLDAVADAMRSLSPDDVPDHVLEFQYGSEDRAVYPPQIAVARGQSVEYVDAE